MSPSTTKSHFFQKKKKSHNQHKSIYLSLPPEMTDSSRSLIPSFLYSSDHRLFPLHEPATNMTQRKAQPSRSLKTSSVSSNGPSFAIPAPNEKVELYSPAYFAACTVGGMLSCGVTHTAVTPLDVLKCNMQVKLLNQNCLVLLLAELILRINIFEPYSKAMYVVGKRN